LFDWISSSSVWQNFHLPGRFASNLAQWPCCWNFRNWFAEDTMGDSNNIFCSIADMMTA
jgi:hypothetical protein